MGTQDTKSYVYPTGSNQTKEQFLFVVDFQNASEITGNSITLTTSPKDQSTQASVSKLEFETTAKRAFALSASPTTINLDEEFKISYTNQKSGEGADSKFNNRKLSLVLTPSAGFPADASLEVSGTVYTMNADGQFIIPQDAVQGGSNTEVTMKLHSATLAASGAGGTLSAELWTSATGNAELPLLGEKAAGPAEIKLTSVADPSLKVLSMSQRLFHQSGLGQQTTVKYNRLNVPTSGKVTLEVLKKTSGSNYASVSTVLESLNGSTIQTGGVFDITLAGDELKLVFSKSADVGTYRLMFKVLDKNDNVLLEVPYNFLIVED